MIVDRMDLCRHSYIATKTETLLKGLTGIITLKAMETFEPEDKDKRQISGLEVGCLSQCIV